MKFFEKMRERKQLKWIIIVMAVVITIIAACAIYVSDYYQAQMWKLLSFSAPENVSVEIIDENTLVYMPEDVKAGFIFYPGGKVEYIAYEPLLKECAAEGIMCVLVQMPFHLAVLDMDAAEGIQERYPDIENWYIGGHSLGGSMAASYLSDNVEEYEGLILLGAYSTADLSETDLAVLSIYGSEDKVLNLEKYIENKTNLPDDFIEVVIEGGCHAYFGVYGEQEGDGVPTISNEEQISQTIDAITEFVL